MANIIHKKILPQYFEAVKSGKKKYEFRVADFEVEEGDTLVLNEWDKDKQEYTGRSIEKKVVWKGKFNPDSFGQREELEKHGFYILSLE